MEPALPMPTPPLFREDLIERYDRPGPRYTSYPATTEFKHRIGDAEYRAWARQSNEELIPRSLSLYFHIPFSSMICQYCACTKPDTGECGYAADYLQDLRREIELQARHFDSDREVRQFCWGGGSAAFLSREQSQQLMTLIENSFRFDRDGGEFSISVDPRSTAPGDIRHLRDLGFNRIRIREPDFDTTGEQPADREERLARTAAVVGEARANGIRAVDVDLVYGLPWQSMAGFHCRLDNLIELAPERIAVYDYAHLPQPYPTRQPSENVVMPDDQYKRAILKMSIERLLDAGYEYIGMGQFVRPADTLATARRQRRLYRNFQGYSTQARSDCIGFGLSAIGQIGDNFSQNASRLDHYHELLESGQLPIVRGYRSTDDDRLRRALIDALLCQFRIDIRALEREWKIDFDTRFSSELESLERMQSDGLLAIDSDEIRVLTPGRLLLRNICMVFDRYRQRETSVTAPAD